MPVDSLSSIQMKTEGDDAVPVPSKGPRKSVSMKDISPQPSTSDVPLPPTERSISRKRGRSAGAKVGCYLSIINTRMELITNS